MSTPTIDNSLQMPHKSKILKGCRKDHTPYNRKTTYKKKEEDYCKQVGACCNDVSQPKTTKQGKKSLKQKKKVVPKIENWLFVAKRDYMVSENRIHQLTDKAKKLITFSQLLNSDIDCVRHLYKVLQDVEAELNRNYHTRRLNRHLYRAHLPTSCPIPTDMNIIEWGIKKNREEEEMDHVNRVDEYFERGCVDPHRPPRRPPIPDTCYSPFSDDRPAKVDPRLRNQQAYLENVQMIGGSSKECESPFYIYIVNQAQKEWFLERKRLVRPGPNGRGYNDDELDRAHPPLIEEPQGPSLKEKMRTLFYHFEYEKLHPDEAYAVSSWLQNIEFGVHRSENVHWAVVVEDEDRRYNPSKYL